MKRVKSTRYLFLVAIVEATEESSPSSSAFRAAPVADETGPGLAKVDAPAVPFPFRKAVSK